MSILLFIFIINLIFVSYQLLVDSHYPLSAVLFLLSFKFNHYFIIVIFKVSILKLSKSKFCFHYLPSRFIVSIFTRVILNFVPPIYLCGLVTHQIFQFSIANWLSNHLFLIVDLIFAAVHHSTCPMFFIIIDPLLFFNYCLLSLIQFAEYIFTGLQFINIVFLFLILKCLYDYLFLYDLNLNHPVFSKELPSILCIYLIPIFFATSLLILLHFVIQFYLSPIF